MITPLALRERNWHVVGPYVILDRNIYQNLVSVAYEQWCERLTTSPRNGAWRKLSKR
jgi:hypothetical protein